MLRKFYTEIFPEKILEKSRNFVSLKKWGPKRIFPNTCARCLRGARN